jgi:xylulokinase
MKYIATFDIGTTAVKGVLVSEDNQIIRSISKNIETIFTGEHKEQKPLDWYSAFCEISRQFFSEAYCPEDILGIIMSGQMQDLIVVDKDCMPIRNGILYSDGRAAPEAEEIAKKVGMDIIMKATGNHFDGSMPFAKLLWMKNNEENLYNRAHKVLISSKDYCIARLTNRYVTDVVSASTSGMMNICGKIWEKNWLKEVGISPELLPGINYSEDLVGTVTGKAASESGYSIGTPVFAGTGDAGSTTLASGISDKGDFNINIGTSGWIACISGDVLKRTGVFNLAAIPKNRYINVVPFLNAGSVHKWISQLLSPEEVREIDYEYIDTLLMSSEAGSNQLLFLPYINGERFPVMDKDVKGCYVGITPNTSKQDMVRASLEGVAFSIKQGYEAIGNTASKITLIGGGARVTVWCQILADTFGQTVYVSNNAEYMPSISLAASVWISQGKEKNYETFISKLIEENNFTCYYPNEKNVAVMKESYERFVSVYPQVKPLFI